MKTWHERTIEEIQLARDGLLKCEVSDGARSDVSVYLQGIEKVLDLLSQDQRTEILTWHLCSEKQPDPGTRFLLRGKKTFTATAFEDGFLPDCMTISVQWSCFKDFVCWAYLNGPTDPACKERT